MYGGNGRGRGAQSGIRGGQGFGFRGSFPPWPYIGKGRGGLPKCSYFGRTSVANKSKPSEVIGGIK
jgi:hypothetical protein